MKKFASSIFVLLVSLPTYSAEIGEHHNMQIEEIEREIQNNQDLYSRPRIAHSVPQTAKHKDPINLYAEACLAKILKSENLAATGTAVNGTALVVFSVIQNGIIEDASFIKSSQNNETDQAIRQTIQRTPSCGEFPAQLKKQANKLSILREYHFIKANPNLP
ncbi:energy transducer TonB [Pseudomonas sp. GOM6]|uniref:energy transducer TonB family protein n=1 Tax=Pseudomonas sp. GOM6 TaxID=3036944 RepID=UPI002409F46C|nr:energy transducer TonB [Pseudomonas sp. GOM6]MDG1582431.1 energy transducer TonB [Pseudomonas sp. GOM6]